MQLSPFFFSALTITTTTDTYSPTINSQSSGWTSYSIRVIIPNAELSSTLTSTSVKVTFRGPQAEPMGIEQAFIGQATSGGNAWDFDGNQVQLQVSSSNSWDVGIDTNVQTDACEIALSPSTDVVIGVDITSNTSKDTIAQVSDTNWTYFYKESNPDEAGTTAPSSFIGPTNNTRWGVHAIEWTGEE